MFSPRITLKNGPAPGGPQLKAAIKALTSREVLVGVPEATNRDYTGKADAKRRMVGNALIAYLMDRGSPARGIPAREFLRPGVKDDQANTVRFMEQGARLALNGDVTGVAKALTAAGLSAQKSIRRKISTGPFTPLKRSTILARKRKHKGRKAILASDTTPLIDSGSLRQAISFQVVDK